MVGVVLLKNHENSSEGLDGNSMKKFLASRYPSDEIPSPSMDNEKSLKLMLVLGGYSFTLVQVHVHVYRKLRRYWMMEDGGGDGWTIHRRGPSFVSLQYLRCFNVGHLHLTILKHSERGM